MKRCETPERAVADKEPARAAEPDAGDRAEAALRPEAPARRRAGALTRRRALGGFAAFLAGAAGLPMAACRRSGAPDAAAAPVALNFSSVPSSGRNAVTVADGYRAQLLCATGDPLSEGLAAYANDGRTAPEEFERRVGDNHDGMRFFGMDRSGAWAPKASEQGVLCVNHEYVNERQLAADFDATWARGADGVRRRADADAVRREQRAVGIGCMALRRGADGMFALRLASPLNRRITALTPTVMRGPAAGSALLRTRHSPDGTAGRGTLDNCANGHTPWGSYLSCEENSHRYFANRAGDLPVAQRLFGVGARGRLGWADLAGAASERADEFSRFDATPVGADATADYRNEPNQFGYVVEVDPFRPDAAVRKRTALGRFAHEGCWPAAAEVGRPLVFYMGDDGRFQCIYKFVSDAVYGSEPAGASRLDIGDHFLDRGTLYAARFDVAANGKQVGRWLALEPEQPALRAANRAPRGPFRGLFSELDSILVHARAAAAAAGATPMDRPEWGAVHPQSGEVYFSLTNNTERDAGSVDAANPRARNRDGHIIRLRCAGDDPAAVEFRWDIFAFGGAHGDAPGRNRSGLTESNEFSSCDGLWFDPAGVLWIQTDGDQPAGNNQMLAAVPGRHGDGGIRAGNSVERLRRFLVGPVGCEVTGVDMTADRRTMFVNLQHPRRAWPDGPGTRARAATVMIRREDGGPIGSG